MSEIIDMMRDIPPGLATAWGGWMAVGLMLLLWHMRARVWEQEFALQQAALKTRTKSGVRRAAPARPAAADAFGELEALLEPGPGSGSLSRRPGD